MERSMIVTSAPMPSAFAAACSPATPPPITTTRAFGVPGTPPRRIPRPPAARIRWYAPTWVESRPATSLIGWRSGS
ncbi:hypothetical protein CMMCA001_07540 [Clavibacter michiganensis subsp. michiganensis]|nr:hypothetical protein CMMCA001_07540 [Clavibacter michiganensis subsp. michiganensis]